MRYSRNTVSDTGVTEESQHTVYVKLALTNWCLHHLEMIDHCATAMTFQMRRPWFSGWFGTAFMSCPTCKLAHMASCPTSLQYKSISILCGVLRLPWISVTPIAAYHHPVLRRPVYACFQRRTVQLFLLGCTIPVFGTLSGQVYQLPTHHYYHYTGNDNRDSNDNPIFAHLPLIHWLQNFAYMLRYMFSMIF